MNYLQRLEAAWIFKNKRLIPVLISILSFALLFAFSSGIFLLKKLEQENPLGDFNISQAYHSLTQLRREALRLQILLLSPPEKVSPQDITTQFNILESRVKITETHADYYTIASISQEELSHFYAEWQFLKSQKFEIVQHQNPQAIEKAIDSVSEIAFIANDLSREYEGFNRKKYLDLLKIRQSLVSFFIISYVLLLFLITLFFIFAIQITWQRQKILLSLNFSEQRYRNIVDTATEGIWALDADRKFTFINLKLSLAFNTPIEKLVGRSVFDFCYSEAAKKILLKHFEELQSNVTVAQDIHLKDAEGNSLWFYVNSTLARLNESGEMNILSMLTDVTQRKEAEKALHIANERLRHQANFDELTQIANRRHFNLYISKLWRQAIEDNRSVSVALLDIDFFKKYNDFYGHLEGDVCLFEVAQLISSVAQHEGDLAARYGGEEFVLVFSDMTESKVLGIMDYLQSELQKLEIKHEKSLVSEYVTFSIGIASGIPCRNTSIEHVLNLADEALYRSKDEGRNCYSHVSF